MTILLISTCKEKLNEREFVLPFVNYLDEKQIDNFTVHYTKVKESDIKKADEIIICGTGLADNDYLKHMDKFAWIKKCGEPIIGICSGAQIVASALGANIKKDFEIGMVKVKGDVFGTKEFDAYSLHQNGITESKEFDVLAKSENSIQIIKHIEKQIYGITFHPEVRNMWVVDKILVAVSGKR